MAIKCFGGEVTSVGDMLPLSVLLKSISDLMCCVESTECFVGAVAWAVVERNHRPTGREL